ncbi:MAG: hypothetical protein HJJLKODD_01626 [Phycisphaerae bacterium]|nr:hypothetical protein [Phycisphaerae bacterium]
MNYPNPDIAAAQPVSDNVVPYPPRYRWLKRTIWAFLFLITLSLLLRLGIGWWTRSQLQAELERIQAAGEPLFPEDFNPPPIPDDQNAALLYKKIAAEIDITDDESDLLQLKNKTGYQQYTAVDWAMVDIAIERNRSHIQCFHEAAALTQADWGDRFRSPVFDEYFDSAYPFSDQRKLARIVVTHMVRLHQQHQDAEAVQVFADLLAYSRAGYLRPTLVGDLVAAAIELLSIDQFHNLIWSCKIADHVNNLPEAEQVSRSSIRQIIVQLRNEEHLQQGISGALQCERMFQIDTITYLLRGRLSLLSQFDWGNTAAQTSPWWEQPYTWMLRPIMENDLRQMTQQMSQVIAAGSQSTWPQAAAIITPIEQYYAHFRNNPIRYIHLFSSILMPSFSRAVQMHYDALAQRRELVIALALRLYYEDHQRLPDELDELVPSYLPKLPINPMSQTAAPYTYDDLPFDLIPPEIPRPASFRATSAPSTWPDKSAAPAAAPETGG